MTARDGAVRAAVLLRRRPCWWAALAVRILGTRARRRRSRSRSTPAPTTRRRGRIAPRPRGRCCSRACSRPTSGCGPSAGLFHAGLALVLVRHLRYFTEPVWAWVALPEPFGLYAGFALVAALCGLWICGRFVMPRVRYISTPSDHLMLALLLAIAALGPGDEVRHPHRRRRAQGLLSRAHGLRLAAVARRPAAVAAPRAGRRADARLPVLQAAARAGRVLLADAQPGRRPARSAGTWPPWAAKLDPKS